MSEDVQVLREMLDLSPGELPAPSAQDKDAPTALVEWDFKSPLPSLPAPDKDKPLVEIDLSLPGLSLPDLPDFSVVPSNGIDWNI